VDFSGSISRVRGSCPNIVFELDGRTVIADGSTDYKKSRCDDVQDGRDASVKAAPLTSGQGFSALRIEVKRGKDN